VKLMKIFIKHSRVVNLRAHTMTSISIFEIIGFYLSFFLDEFISLVSLICLLSFLESAEFIASC
jgi:hypothetical protein